MDTVRQLRVRAVRVPMTEPHRTASGVITESPLVLIDAEIAPGLTGHAILFAYTVAALGPLAELVRNLAPLVEGQPLAPAERTAALLSRFKLLGTQGLVGMAIAGIDMALWDALAKVCGLPLARLLGAQPRPVPAYGPLGFDGAAACARAAERLAAQGFSAMKAKIGYPTLDEDISVIEAIRAAIGPERQLMVDYNQSLSVAEALRRLRALEQHGLTWVEEPTRAHDYAGHARIAQEISTPIQAGENWWGPFDFQLAVEAQATDFVMPDVMKIGGVTGWQTAVALAAARGLPVSNHLWPEISAQLLSVLPGAHWLEYSDWWNPILAEPLALSNGFTVPPEQPGSGIAWNENAVQRWLV